MSDSERLTLPPRIRLYLVHTLFILPGTIALLPYSMRPVEMTTPVYLAPVEYLIGVGPYLAAHPFRALLVLVTCLWLGQMLRGVPRV